MSMKRPRDDSADVVLDEPVAAAPVAAQQPASSALKQCIEIRGTKSNETKIVKNSPYGSSRGSLGWGNPFQPAPKAIVDGNPNIHIGISSLNGVPGKDREMGKLLAQYMKKFMCLEHCYPYHRMCDTKQWTNWTAMVAKRPEFCFTVKANMYLTHTRMLEMDVDLASHIDNFFTDRCLLLGPHLGPVLVQLPPQFHCKPNHLDRIRAVAARIPKSVRVAVEFRHKSWYQDEVYELLRSIGWGFVVTHNEDVGESPFVITNPQFLYVRLHGAVSRFVGDYGPVLMKRWAEVVADFVRGDASRHVYFFMNNNESEIGGLMSSVADATYLAQQIAQSLKTRPDAPRPSMVAAVTPAGPVMGGLEMEVLDLPENPEDVDVLE